MYPRICCHREKVGVQCEVTVKLDSFLFSSFLLDKKQRLVLCKNTLILADTA